MNKRNEHRVRFATCPKDCYGGCVFEAYWDEEAEEKNFLYGKPLRDHPFTKGFFCSKLNKREKLLYHPKRLRSAFQRKGDKGTNNFKNISIDKALNLIKEKVESALKLNTTSILGAFYAGNSGLISQHSPLRFFNLINGTVTRGGICNEGGCEGLHSLFGTYSTTNPFQIVNPNAKLIVIWGSNLSANNIHMYRLVRDAMKRNALIIVIDPRKTRLAIDADLFIKINPGMDHLLVKVIINELFKSGQIDKQFLEKHVEFETNIIKKAHLTDLKRIILKIGASKKKIMRFVELLGEYKHQTLFILGYGPQKRIHGGKIIRAIALIQIMLGNLGKRGTGIIYSQSDFKRLLKRKLINYIENGLTSSKTKEIELINLDSELKTKKYKVLFIYNFNPVSSLPNQNSLRNTLKQKDLFTVVIDMFFNETTKYADLVIPAKFSLEQYDIFAPFFIPSFSITEGGPCTLKNCLTNYEFFQKLEAILGLDKDDLMKEPQKDIFLNCLRLFPKKIKKNLLNNGYHLIFEEKSIPFEDLKFPTKDHKIHIPPHSLNFETFEEKRKKKVQNNEFLLISPSHKFFLHSQLGPIQESHLIDFDNVYLSPKDIKELHLKNGETVNVYNKYGSAKYELNEMKSLKQGLALIYKGFPSRNLNHPNVNIFTPSQEEELGHSGAYYSTFIKISQD